MPHRMATIVIATCVAVSGDGIKETTKCQHPTGLYAIITSAQNGGDR